MEEKKKIVNVLHSGDLHLGAGGRDREKREERFIVFTRLLAAARREKASALLLAGDFLEQAALTEEELMRIRSMLSDFASPDCPVFITPGNHDPADPLSPYRRENFWPEEVYILIEPCCLPFPELGFSLSGAGFRQVYQREPLLPKIEAAYEAAEAEGKLSDCPLALAVLHGEIRQGPGGLYNPIDLKDLAASPFHYLALAHVHATDETLRQAGPVYFSFCGAPQGSSKKDEGEKGARLLRFEGAKLRDSRLLPLAVRVFRSLDVTLEAASNAEEALQQIRAQIDEASRRFRDEKCCWSLHLKGESAGQYIPDPEQLKQHLESSGYLISGIEDQTRFRYDEDKLRKEDSLRGLFFRDMEKKMAASSGEERDIYELALRLGLDAFRGDLIS